MLKVIVCGLGLFLASEPTETTKQSQRFSQFHEKGLSHQNERLANKVKVMPTGQELFSSFCLRCHSNSDRGLPRGFFGGDLRNSRYRYKREFSESSLQVIIRKGIPKTAMQPFGETLSAKEIELIARFLKDSRAQNS